MNIFEGDIAFDGLLSDILIDGGVEGQASTQHEEHNHSQTEHIDPFIELFLEIYFWGNKSWSAGIFILRIHIFEVVFVNCKAEIDDFYPVNQIFLSIHLDKNVLWFEITVNQSQFVV